MALDLDALRVFVRVAELSSFTRAARQLGMPRARASAHVQRLEAALSTPLLQRSTRVVRLTSEGEQLMSRATSLLIEADELAALFRTDAALLGRVRVEAPVMVARDVVIPNLPALLARHPDLRVDIRASDRFAAAMREGLDIVVRVGPVHEPGLVGRRIGEAPMMNGASPSYLRAHGTPRGLEDLAAHVVVHYAAETTPTFEYRDGDVYRQLPMRAVVSVDSFEAYEAAGVAGLGIVQLPRHERRGDDTLVEILPGLTACPASIAILHTHGRSPPRRVRAVMEWLTEVLSPLAPSAHEPRGQRVANGATDTRPSQTSAYILKSPASDHTG